MKTAIIILTLIIVLYGLLYFGIYNQRNCAWANIDNIEIHAKIDIPKIKTYECEYIKKQNLKMARFDIEKNEIAMERYIQTNKFIKLTDANNISLKLLKKEINIIGTSNLYYTIGTQEGETWQTVLDTSTGHLWVTIKYKN
jgi:hypothetical protein